MNYQNSEVLQRLQNIESTLQERKTEDDISELKSVVSELKHIVQSLDKDIAIHAEKQSHLFYRVEQLQKELELLEQKGVKSSDKRRALIENTLMVFLGGLITYLFGLISNN